MLRPIQRKTTKVNKNRLLRESETLGETIKYIDDSNVDIDSKDYQGRTALMNATMLDHKDQMKILIAAKADINIEDNEGYTALIFARTADAAKLLLDAGAIINDNIIEHFTWYAQQEVNRIMYISPSDAQEILELLKQTQHEKEELKFDNVLSQLRQKVAKTIDNKLGTHLSTVQIPKWAKEAEASLAQAIENKDNKKNTPLLAKNKQKDIKNNNGR